MKPSWGCCEVIKQHRHLILESYTDKIVNIPHTKLTMQPSSLFEPVRRNNTDPMQDLSSFVDSTTDPRLVQKKLLGAIERYKQENPKLSEQNTKLKKKMERVSRDCEVIAENHRLMRMLKSLETTNRKLKTHNAQITGEIQKMERQGQKFLETLSRGGAEMDRNDMRSQRTFVLDDVPPVRETRAQDRNENVGRSVNLWDEFRRDTRA